MEPKKILVLAFVIVLLFFLFKMARKNRGENYISKFVNEAGKNGFNVLYVMFIVAILALIVDMSMRKKCGGQAQMNSPCPSGCQCPPCPKCPDTPSPPEPQPPPSPPQNMKYICNEHTRTCVASPNGTYNTKEDCLRGGRCNMDLMCPADYSDINSETGMPDCPVDMCDSQYTTKGKDGKIYTLDCSANEGCPRGKPKKEITYIDVVNKVCPGTYAWQFDDLTSTYTCGSNPKTKYTIRFGAKEPKNLKSDGVIATGEDKSDKSRTITLQNTLGEPVWLGVIAKSKLKNPNGTWAIPPIMDGYKIESNHEVTFSELPNDWFSVKINPRLGCKQGGDGKWSCETGDCSSADNNWGRRCKINGVPCCFGDGVGEPTGSKLSSGVEMTFDVNKGMDYYDISYLDAVDIPIFVSTTGKTEDCNGCNKDDLHNQFNCRDIGCGFDTNMSWCPEAYKHKVSDARTVCASPCQISSDQELLWKLYAKYKEKQDNGQLNDVGDNSVKKFVDFLDLVEVPSGGTDTGAIKLDKPYDYEKQCSENSQCGWNEVVDVPNPPPDMPPYRIVPHEGKCVPSYEEGQNPVNRCVPIVGCLDADACAKRGKKLGESKICGAQQCENTMLVPRDAFNNEFGRSKIKAQLCCSCGCSTEFTDVFPPSNKHTFQKFNLDKKLMKCGNTCCDDGCYFGCTPNNWTTDAPKCNDETRGIICSDFPQQSCDVKNKKLWPTFNNF